jgi:hypothetical protein
MGARLQMKGAGKYALAADVQGLSAKKPASGI